MQLKKQKKTKKVKKKVVRYNKKKKVKKRKRRKRKKITMEDFYKILNEVQLKKKIVTFVTDIEKVEVIEHIIKDADLKYGKNVMKTQVVFTLHPNEEQIDYDIIDVEYLDDEITEEGQIFP